MRNLLTASVIALFGVLALSLQLYARSPYHGVHLAKIHGETLCNIRANKVSILVGETRTTRKIDLNEEELSALVRASQKHPIELIAVHVRATYPVIELVAGITPDVKSFTLYKDSTSISGRVDKDSKELIRIIEEYCGEI